MSSLRTQTALAQMRGALAACRSSLRRARQEIDNLSAGVSTLSGKIEEAQVKIPGEILGLSRQSGPSNPETEGDAIKEALALSEKEVRAVLDRLTWWKMVWRVDEISGVVGGAVERAWCRELEKQVRAPNALLETRITLFHS